MLALFSMHNFKTRSAKLFVKTSSILSSSDIKQKKTFYQKVLTPKLIKNMAHLQAEDEPEYGVYHVNQFFLLLYYKES